MNTRPTSFRAAPRQCSVGWLPLLLALVCAPLLAARATPLHDPKRVINGMTVDLMPLFHWWTNQIGSRPLTAWVHIQGRITGTNSLGWIVSGTAEKSSGITSKEKKRETAGERDGQKFILKHPPLPDAAAFESLRQQLNDANAERARVQKDEANAKSKESKAQHSARGRNRSLSTAQLHNVEQADKNQLQLIDDRIQDLKTKLAVYPNEDHYQVDVIALDTETESARLPVYDHGAVR